MTTIELNRVKGGRFEAPELGWIKQKGWTNDFIGEAAGIDGQLTFSRNWTTRHHTITDAIGRVRGEHVRQGWLGASGPMSWDDVDYEFAMHSSWKGSFVLRRLNEDLATFQLKRLGRTVEIELLDGASVPAGLLLVGAWLAILRHRDAAAASG